MNWKEILSELNMLTMSIFGEIFYNPDGRQTDIIALHDEFLDFIDAKSEDCPQQLSLFLESFKSHPLLKNIPAILRMEGVIV
jgi:hypothetical protein